MFWFVFVFFAVLAFTLPTLWCVCNRICCFMFPAGWAWVGAYLRTFARVWVGMFFACVWLSIQPRQTIVDVDALSNADPPIQTPPFTPPIPPQLPSFNYPPPAPQLPPVFPSSSMLSASAWEWQLPLYAAIPVVLVFNNQSRRITCCVLLEKLCTAILASFTSFVLLILVWTARASSTGQGFVFSLFQPTISGTFVVVQSAWKKRKNALLHAHILEVLIVFQSFLYGSIFTDSFTVWKLPLFALISYTIGMIVVFVTVLFIALPWSLSKSSESDAINENDDEEDEATRTKETPQKDVRKSARPIEQQDAMDEETPQQPKPMTKNEMTKVQNSPKRPKVKLDPIGLVPSHPSETIVNVMESGWSTPPRRPRIKNEPPKKESAKKREFPRTATSRAAPARPRR